MRILLKTLPLRNGNYGGILQAVALSAKFSELGYDVHLDAKIQFSFTTRTMAKYSISFFTGKSRTLLTNKVRNSILREFLEFANVELNLVDFSVIGRHLLRIKKSYDAFVVGSDQVWRPAYGRVQEYMFDFLGPNSKSTPRFSYAASFGKELIDEYSEQLVNRCKKLMSRFTSVSVRESSGIRICSEVFGVEAVQVLDPVLLWDANFYQRFFKKGTEQSKEKKLLLFTLDKNLELESRCMSLSKDLGCELEIFENREPANSKDFRLKPEDFILKSPRTFLQSFSSADYIVTDSYHGVLFAIVFRKPFLTSGNAVRGQDRFLSILNSLGLSNQLLKSWSAIKASSLQSLDWSKVDARLNELRLESLKYIQDALSGFKQDP